MRTIAIVIAALIIAGYIFWVGIMGDQKNDHQD